MKKYKEKFLFPGEFFIAREPHIISTVLGSCISVTLYNKKYNFGAINHYLLPEFNSNYSDEIILNPEKSGLIEV